MIYVLEMRHSIMEHFSFLVKDYNFKFDKIALGDMRDENGIIVLWSV